MGAIDNLFKPLDPYVVRAKVNAFVELYLAKEELRRRDAQELEEQFHKEWTHLELSFCERFRLTVANELKATQL